MNKQWLQIIRFLLVFTVVWSSMACAVEHIIIGIDDKVAFLEGGLTKVAPKVDRICILTIDGDPLSPDKNCSLVLENSIFGPPVNVTLTPDNKFAVVANSVSWVKEEGAWQAKPDVDMYLLAVSDDGMAVQRDKIIVPEQPSGIAISRDGQYVAVAHRAAKAVSLLRIVGAKLFLLDTLSLGKQISAVAFTPDATRIFATQFDGHAVVVMDILQEKLRQAQDLIPVGLWPYNLKIDPKGRYAVVANTGNSGLPDGHHDTLSMIDIQQFPAVVVNTVSVGDGPEGLAISRDGDLIAVPLLQGSAASFKGKNFYNKSGGLVVYRQSNLALEEIARFEVGGFPEGVVFSKNGRWIYLANLIDKNVEVFSVKGKRVKQTGIKVGLPGQPVSMGNALP